MLFSSMVPSLTTLLQLCLNTLRAVWVIIFSQVCFWPEESCKGTTKKIPSKGRQQTRPNRKSTGDDSNKRQLPFTRKCNYKCGFCFHTAKTSFVLPLEEAKRGLKLLKAAGMEKINFSGGEPFLHDRGEFLGKLVQFCRQDLQLPSVTIVSNGSMIKEKWFQKYGEYLDILAISCDSFDEATNQLIGRTQGRKSHINCLFNISSWCQQYKVAFKVNSVINTFNVDEDMTEAITQLGPVRWKVFQCLLIDGENAGENALREAERFVIRDEQFQEFLDRHSSISCLIPESNEKMRNSYLILDEYMRFLDCRNGRKDPSKSILDVGVKQAIRFSGFDEKMFLKRGGKYLWSKVDMKLDW